MVYVASFLSLPHTLNMHGHINSGTVSVGGSSVYVWFSLYNKEATLTF